MRYSGRRLRRKFPNATIILGCWAKEVDPAGLASLREGAKADLAAISMSETVKLCIEATGVVTDADHATSRPGAPPENNIDAFPGTSAQGSLR